MRHSLTDTSNGLLFILNPPPFSSVSAFTKKPKTQEAEEGSSAVFEAETEKPDAKVKWQCNAKDIAIGNKYAITAERNKHSLTIKDITQEDATVYAVIAGGSKVKFELKVVSKPGGRLWCCSCVFEVSGRSPEATPSTSRMEHSMHKATASVNAWCTACFWCSHTWSHVLHCLHICSPRENSFVCVVLKTSLSLKMRSVSHSGRKRFLRLAEFEIQEVSPHGQFWAHTDRQESGFVQMPGSMHRKQETQHYPTVSNRWRLWWGEGGGRRDGNVQTHWKESLSRMTHPTVKGIFWRDGKSAFHLCRK